MTEAGERCPVCQHKQKIAGPICQTCEDNINISDAIIEILRTPVCHLTQRQTEIMSNFKGVDEQTMIEDFSDENMTVRELIRRQNHKRTI